MSTTNLLITDGNGTSTAVYISNGSSDGTEVGAGSGLTTPSTPAADNFSDLTTIGSDVFFVMKGGSNSESILYEYDGTTIQALTSSTDYVGEFLAPAIGLIQNAVYTIDYNGDLVFSETTSSSEQSNESADDYQGTTLAVYNPSTQATTQISGASGGYDPSALVVANGDVYYLAYTSLSATPSLGLYEFDGTTATLITAASSTLNSTAFNNAGGVGSFATFNGNVYFSGFGIGTLYEYNTTSGTITTAETFGGSGSIGNGTIGEIETSYATGSDLYMTIATVSTSNFSTTSASGIYELNTSGTVSELLPSVLDTQEEPNGYVLTEFAPVVYNGDLYFEGSYLNGNTPEIGLYESTNGTSATKIADFGNGNPIFIANGVVATQDASNDNQIDTYTLAGGATSSFTYASTATIEGTVPFAVPSGLWSEGTITSASPTISSATYDVSTGDLTVSGSNFTTSAGDYIATALTLTGEGGNTYTLTGGSTIEASPTSTTFIVDLGAADQLAVDGLLNKNSTSSIGGTTYNLAATSSFDTGGAADTTSAVTVSNALTPTISSVGFDDATGVLTLSGTGFENEGSIGGLQDGDFTLTGQGGSDLLASGHTAVSSETSATITLTGAALTNAKAFFNINGTSSSDGTTYNFAATAGWDSDAGAAITTEGVTVSGVVPTVTSIDTVGSNPNNADSDQFTVTFSESVTGVATSSFVLTDTGSVAGTIMSVGGSGASYTVTVGSVTGDGTMRLDLKSSGTGIESEGTPISGGFTSGETYTIDQPPVANNDSYTATENSTLTVNAATGVLVNDTDPSGGPLTAIDVTNPTDGSLTLNSNGAFTYTPNANFFGFDSFTYKDNDGTFDSNTATVTIDMSQLAPTVLAESALVVAGATATGTSGTSGTGALDGDSDPNSQSLSISAVTGGTVGSAVAGTYGTLTLDSDGSYTYVANNSTAIAAAPAGSHPADTFDYTVSDTGGVSAPATITFTIDRPPVAAHHTATVVAAASTGTVPAGDSDPDGDTVTVTGITGAAVGSPDAGTYGTLTVNANDTYSYTANNTAAINAAPHGSHPTDTFTYTVSDGHGGTAVETLSFTIDRPPLAAEHTATVLEAASTGTVAAGDSDPDGDTVTVTGITGGTVGSPEAGTYGTLTVNANDTYSYTANNTAAINAAPQGSHPTDTFTYTVSDGNGGTTVETLSVAIDRPPESMTHHVTAHESASTGTLAAGDIDPDGDTIIVTAISGGTVGSPEAGTYGTLTVNANDTYSYTANNIAAINNAPHGSPLTDSFFYTASDGQGGSAIETLTITINRASPPSDVTGDGMSDVLWEQSNGTLAEWLMNGSAITASLTPTDHGMLIQPNASWSVVGYADFYGAGESNILWRQSTTGLLPIWSQNGTAVTSQLITTSQGQAATPDASWSIVGVGDFNGDGDADIMWRQTTTNTLEDWSMNGSIITSSQAPTFQGQAVTPDGSWSVAGVGDFNGDGKTDLLWRQGTTNILEDWSMNGSTITSNQALTFQGQAITPDASWSVAGVGDFNGDGNSDLLWRQGSTGILAMWLMNGSTVTSSQALTYQGHAVTPDTSWNIVEIGDFNGDGNSDVLWQQSTTGLLAEWQMSGATIVAAQSITSQGSPVTPNQSWQVQEKPTDLA